MSTTRRLWVGLAVLLVASFSVLLWVGGEIHPRHATDSNRGGHYGR